MWWCKRQANDWWLQRSIDAVMKSGGVEEYRIVGRVSGAQLEQLTLHPFYERELL